MIAVEAEAAFDVVSVGVLEGESDGDTVLVRSLCLGGC